MATPEFAQGVPCWIDLCSSDPEKSEKFYGTLFGWTAEDSGEEFGHYVNFSKDGQLVAGMVPNTSAGTVPDTWTTYLKVADAKATAAAVTAAGGRVHVEPMRVRDLGTMAVFEDPSGATIGAWHPGQHKGFGAVELPGTPCWHELSTRDYDAAVAFYQQAFGWQTDVVSDTADFRYTTLIVGVDAMAGIYDAAGSLPAGTPSHWIAYLGTSDVDRSLATVTELGGAVVRPAWDTPYGRMSVVADSTGAVFSLIQV